MRTLCGVCEKAAAILFCAADETALCHACDENVHLCNKLANRRVHVGLADPSAVTHCDICENAPDSYIQLWKEKFDVILRVGKMYIAFFYCEVNGTSLCQQCDMIVHVGGKRTHRRYLLFRQRVEFPGDNSVHLEEAELQADDPGEVRRNQNQITPDSLPNYEAHPVDMLGTNVNINGKMDVANEKPDLPREANMVQTSNNQTVEGTNGTKTETASFLPIGSFNRETRKL